MMKKLLFLSVLLLCSIIASAADFTIDGICYNITSTNPLTVEVAYSDSYSGDIVIPEKVEYEGKEYSVTSIGNSAFEHTGLTSLTIPNSVNSIGEWAFSGCGGLTSVTIPKSVTSIGGWAFSNCSALTTIVVKNGNTVFDSRDNCNAIIRTTDNVLIAGCKNTIIPNSVTTIGENAFLWCCMSSITIPNSVTTIKDEAFFDCYGLTSMTIPSSVTSIGNRAFQACSSLTSLTIPESVTNIGVDAFRGCSGLTSIIVKSGNNIYDSRDNSNAIIRTADNKLILGCQNTIIPENVTSIGENAFDECVGLVSVTIPNKVTTIEQGAFRKCYNLKSVTIPSSVTNIGRFAFEGCNSLTVIVVDSGNTVYDSRDNCNAIIRTSDNQLIAGCHGTIIPNSVTSIGYSAFALFNNLTTITIPNSVKSIGDFAFYYCTGLTSVTIPNSVTSIGNSAFSNCPSLTEVISMIEEPFAIRSNCWDRVNTQEIPLYVPAGTKEKYENTEGWNVFKNIVETGNVITHQCPDDNHPHMIDLGLPSGTKLACCNVGASKPEDYGGYYAWGEIEEKDVYDWSMYIHWDENAGACNDIGSDISGTDYDVAHVKWSGSWVMPSIEQYRELRSNTTAEWTTENGVNGFRFTSSNGRAIFLPDAGFRWESGLYDKGCYWCSSSNWSEGLVYADMMTFEDGKMWDGANLRYRGIPVRPVVAGSSTPSGITIDETTFPDENFRNWVLAQDYGQDGVLTEAEIAGVMEIDVNNKNIASLKGIEYFTTLTSLYCYNNQLTSLDVSQNTALMQLRCYGNQLTSLDVSQNTALKYLECDSNQLTTLDVSNNTALMGLGCSYNQLTVFDVSQNTALTWLDCCGNQLTSLDVSKNTALMSLECDINQLTSLDLSQNTALFELNCGYNQLTTLSLSKNTALTRLTCSNNQLFSLDVSQNTALTVLFCSNNQLTSLDVSKNTALTQLECHKNQLTSLDVSQNTALMWLYCYYNKIKGTAMDGLIASLPETGGELIAIAPNDPDEQNIVTKAQVVAAKEKGWIIYTNIWDESRNKYEEYEGSEPEMEPIENGETINIGDEIDENTNLNGNVVDNVFVNISNGDGGFDPVEGCLIVSKPTEDSAINGKDIFGDDFKDNYTGIVFKVNEGKGSIKVEAETQGNMVLKVKIGNSDPIEMELDGKLKVKFPYNVSEETLVYIYGGLSDAAGAKGTRASTDGNDLLKIYGFEIVSDPSGIDATENGKQADAPVYNLNGQRVNTPSKGVYIKNGRKVIVK